METKALIIVNSLLKKGFDAYFVGGCVRDKIMGQLFHDIDIATNAHPNDIKSIFGKSVKFVGKSFGVTLVNGIEVATFRTEKCYGLSDKNVTVSFAKTIQEDLSRRDFTMNAIAYNPITKEIVDPFNGRDDIEHKVIRFVGDAKERIYEDPCRILRGLRFASVLGFRYELYTERALNEFAFMVHLIPKERVRLELLKTLKGDTIGTFFNDVFRFDILKYIFPSLDDAYNVSQNRHHAESIFDHCILCGGHLPKEKPLLRLAGVLHDIGKTYTKRYSEKTDDFQFLDHESVSVQVATKELELLTFSNDEIAYVTGIIALHMRIINRLTPRGIRRLVAKCVKLNVDLDDFIAMKGADAKANLAKKSNFIEGHDVTLRKRIDDVMTKEAAFSIKDMNISGHDVMTHLNIGPGRGVGDVLKRLFDKVLDDPTLNNRETLLKLI